MEKSNAVYSPSGFFVLRTPLLPLDDWVSWSQHLEFSSGAEAQPSSQLLAADRGRVRQCLRSLIERPEVHEALFIASPDFEATLGEWLHAPDSERGQKVEGTLVRYLSRMASRATPFGLCAGYTVGTIGETTHLELSPRDRYRRHTRLDMDYLCTLTDALEREPRLRSRLTYRPNSSLYNLAGRLRYAEALADGVRSRVYCLTSVEPADYLQAVLDAASVGGAHLDELARILGELTSVPLPEARAFIEALVDSQILVSDLVPAVTGPEPIISLLDHLSGEAGLADLHSSIEQAYTALAEIDAGGLGAKPQQYRALARHLEALPAEVHLSRLFQVDMRTAAPNASLSPRVVDEIARGVTLLEHISLPRVDSALRRFREAFLARYEGRAVPLVEALDGECGVGFDATTDPGADPSPLLQDLDFGDDSPEPTPAADASRQALLLRLWERAIRDNTLEVRLTEEDIRLLEQRNRPAPLDTFSVMVKLVAPSEQALARGDFRLFIMSVLSASGAQLMGRFCHADPQLRRDVEAYLRAEEAHAADAVFAEIVHLPEGRTGNILERPVLRRYEIPYLGSSGAPPERQLPISDLTVSVVGERIVLRSLHLGCEVIPRLTSAHNYRHRSLGMYRFLCALQHQDRASTLEWSWGPLDAAPFVPRVAFRRFVLARARWTVRDDQLRTLDAKTADGRFQALQDLRAALRLPRFIELADDDRLLPVDLDNVLCCEALIQLIKGRSMAHLVEMFPSPDEGFVSGPEGRFAHELLVPFVRKPSAEPRCSLQRPVPVPMRSVRRSFAPGSEWLYAKLYTAASMADSVLREAIMPVVRQSLSFGAADLWFFIRYSDPHRHLRVRFRGDAQRLHAEVLPALAGAVASGRSSERVWRFQLDTYEREIERYGGPHGIELAEAIFCADSEAVLALTTEPQISQDLDVRWQLALCGIDQLLDDFGLDLTSKLQLVKQLRGAYSREFQIDAEFERQLSVKYRAVRPDVERLIASGREQRPLELPGVDIFQQRSDMIAPYIAQLKDHERAGRLSQPWLQLAASFTHMHTNRLLQSAARAQELVLYDYLRRCYTSRLARQDTPPGTPNAFTSCG